MLKKLLYQYCTEWAEQRYNAINEAIKDAQDSVNSDDKSSAGDKHETGRAMMQLEVEQKSNQLLEAEKLRAMVKQFSSTTSPTKVAQGSLVLTNNGNYYISISAGKIELEGEVYFAVSPLSPIASAMLGKAEGESFAFNDKMFVINKLL